MNKWIIYSIGFITGVVMIGLFTLGFNLQSGFGDVLFAFSMILWPLGAIVAVGLNLTVYKTNPTMKNILTKTCFMPLLGAIVMVALLYMIL